MLAPLMVIAMIGVVSWRFDVIAALPSATHPALLHQAKLYELLLLTPALVYDTLRRSMPHRAYLIDLGPIPAYMTVAHFA